MKMCCTAMGIALEHHDYVYRMLRYLNYQVVFISDFSVLATGSYSKEV